MNKCSMLVLVLGCVVLSCDQVRRFNGPELTEPAEVYDACYVPAGHGSGTAIGYNFGEKGGVTFTPIDVHIPARYAVVFKCQHGKFIIVGKRGEALYKKFSKGDEVIIHYCEVFEVKKGKTNAVDLHFLDATKTTQP